jgi:hypothetical protein
MELGRAVLVLEGAERWENGLRTAGWTASTDEDRIRTNRGLCRLGLPELDDAVGRKRLDVEVVAA